MIGVWMRMYIQMIPWLDQEAVKLLLEEISALPWASTFIVYEAVKTLM